MNCINRFSESSEWHRRDASERFNRALSRLLIAPHLIDEIGKPPGKLLPCSAAHTRAYRAVSSASSTVTVFMTRE